MNIKYPFEKVFIFILIGPTFHKGALEIISKIKSSRIFLEKHIPFMFFIKGTLLNS